MFGERTYHVVSASWCSPLFHPWSKGKARNNSEKQVVLEKASSSQRFIKRPIKTNRKGMIFSDDIWPAPWKHPHCCICQSYLLWATYYVSLQQPGITSFTETPCNFQKSYCSLKKTVPRNRDCKEVRGNKQINKQQVRVIRGKADFLSHYLVYLCKFSEAGRPAAKFTFTIKTLSECFNLPQVTSPNESHLTDIAVPVHTLSGHDERLPQIDMNFLHPSEIPVSQVLTDTFFRQWQQGRIFLRVFTFSILYEAA